MPQQEARDELSLEQIEDSFWGDAPADATRLIRTVHEVRRKPLGSLDAEDFRLLLLQQISTDVLVPRALAKLEQDPLWEGDFYPGDVLSAVLHLPEQYWQTHREELARLRRVIESLGEPAELEEMGAPSGVIAKRVEEFPQRTMV
ncbi:contact-dependent growth inhibition system immunity protein [Amycolatopsis rhizosphaerae]|uniref:contact-dependent growth inhibition system immunity protein n=1 Tax=Amycolatopsis rhizosphaerae TaxID=2053003 RepID=UPI001FE438A7|nr:contact-dependent growth inhibition system immunity protein [Amycolatopsis rhizosphaerae]